jgi:type I pantothenate kinase
VTDEQAGEGRRFLRFTGSEWAALAASTPLTLSEADLADMQGIGEHVSLDEVASMYLPLSRLLNLHVAGALSLRRTMDAFLGKLAAPVPFVVAIAGSVAVGKSTTARILKALLARWPDHPSVDLVTTDGFLHPNAVLSQRGLVHRKGFPESYDRSRLVRFLLDLKAGTPAVSVPVYDHRIYDTVPGREQVVRQPDIVVLEGLNVLQRVGPRDGLLVADLIDFSIFVDADLAHIRRWYVERFLTLKRAAANDPGSFFAQWSGLSDDDATSLALSVWTSINEVNLVDNILPTRTHANLILTKDVDHRIREVKLRTL